MKKTIFIAAAVLTSSQLHAQDSTRFLQEVTVTANKISQKQDETGKVITVITKEQLEKKGGRTLTQILNEQAGITINGALNGLGNPQTLYVRGASAGRTLVLMDGIPVYDPSLINSEFDLNLLLVSDIEQIEISRGAQSTLYGSDAVAGVVNIITSKANISKPFNAKATVTGGSFNTFRTNAQVYGKIDKLTYNAKVANINSKGFSSAYDSTGNMGFAKDGYHGTLVNTSLQYQLTTQFMLKSFIQSSQYKTDIVAGSFTDEKDYTVKNKSLITGAGFLFKNAGVTLTGNYQYSDITRNYFNDSIDVPTFIKFSTDKYFGKTQFAELYAAINLGKNFTLLQGADYRFGDMNSRYFSISSFGPYISTFTDTSVSQASLYASLFYKTSNEKFNASLGGRLNVHSRYGSNATYTFNTAYAFTKYLNIFGSIGTAFKAPTLYQLYSSYGNPGLKPETSRSYEIGVQQKQAVINNRLVFFYRESTNGLDFDYNNFQYFNFIKQVVRGLEIESLIKPTEQLNISFNYTYLSPTEKTQSRKTFADTAYSYLIRRAKNSFNISAGYQLTPAAYVNVSAKYTGNRFDVGGYQSDDVALKSYFILGAYAEYKIHQCLKVFADAQNITNKKFFDVRGYNSIPFMINGGFTFTL